MSGMEDYEQPEEPQIQDQQQSQQEDDVIRHSEKKDVNTADEELEQVLASHKANIKVVGAGGGGNNTVNRLTEVGVAGCDSIAINTDAQDLLYTNADKKILIGRETTRGMGAGSMPKLGEESAKESEHELRKALEGADMIFLTCGMGGGTGTGALPVCAEIGKKLGALVVGIVTMPFTMEGQKRYENAVLGLERLENVVDTLIVIPNDKLIELVPDLPLHTAFKVADELLTNAVKGIAELVTKAGLVNLDFADIRTVMGDGGVALIGVGESDSDKRAQEAVEKAVNNPLLDVDVSGATGALINVTGGPTMTLEEARQVIATVSDKLDQDARIIWGAQISEDLKSTLKVLLIITGVKSSQIFGSKRTFTGERKEGMKDDLGIDFL